MKDEMIVIKGVVAANRLNLNRFKDIKQYAIFDSNDNESLLEFDWKYKFDPEEDVDHDVNCIYKKIKKLVIYDERGCVDEFFYFSMEKIVDNNGMSLYYKDIFYPALNIDGDIAFVSKYNFIEIVNLIEGQK
ncbi:MAG: hypothetical protein MJZ34_07950 [Paludibacteraceae bacterium]|nr:hypothetical protein [Paludibacteraceae bacterium]